MPMFALHVSIKALCARVRVSLFKRQRKNEEKIEIFLDFKDRMETFKERKEGRKAAEGQMF